MMDDTTKELDGLRDAVLQELEAWDYPNFISFATEVGSLGVIATQVCVEHGDKRWLAWLNAVTSKREAGSVYYDGMYTVEEVVK